MASIGPSRSGERRGLIRERPAIITGLALVAVSALVVLAAGTRPGFDPYGWLVWGHQTIHGSLDTNAAPSWKPLPYLFTAPYALAGHYELWLWMVTSVAVSLSGVLFAGRIAYRLTGAPPERRYAAIAAASVAGLGVLMLRDYPHYVLSFQSDPMIVALCLGAIDCHLSRRHRWALALIVLASLGRPEVWPFAGLYALWAARAMPRLRLLVLAGVAVTLFLWFGIPGLTSKSFFIAGSNALRSGRALHNNKVFGTVDRFLDLHESAIQIGALVSIGLAIVRRDRVVLALAAGAFAWVLVEIAFALHGWPGLPRYLFEPAAVMVVLAGIAAGRLLADPPRFTRAPGWLGAGAASRARAPGRLARAPGWIGAGLVALMLVALVPALISRVRIEHKDLLAQRTRTTEINRLASAVSAVGGAARVRGCGESLTRLEYQTVLAWQIRENVARVGFRFSKAIHSGRPIVLFTPKRHGWAVQAVHQRRRGCVSLRASPHA